MIRDMAARKTPVTERCPTCQGPLPEPKTCPECGKVFYRGQNGSTTAVYCSDTHKNRAAQRRYRAADPERARAERRRQRQASKRRKAEATP
jgi:uncharacterized Zn finger protein (UPF0148 family)